MQKVYFVSGLGADERVFADIKLAPSLQVVHIHWIRPFPSEPLSHYVKRLISDQIDTTGPVCLVGLSFGGIICQEIAKQIPCRKVVIISSVKSYREMSLSFRILRKMRLDKVFPISFLKFANQLTAGYFFSPESEEEVKLLHQIIDDTDWVFSKWAIGELMRWKQETPPENILHLHGTEDRIFPVSSIKNYAPLPGGHFMVLGRATEVSRLLNEAFLTSVVPNVEA